MDYKGTRFGLQIDTISLLTLTVLVISVLIIHIFIIAQQTLNFVVNICVRNRTGVVG